MGYVSCYQKTRETMRSGTCAHVCSMHPHTCLRSSICDSELCARAYTTFSSTCT